MQWLIPMMHNVHDYIDGLLYGHTFASAIEKQSLATEDVQKQLNNRFEVRETPIRDKHAKKSGADPFPWLDKEDPQKI